jgi:hypothetical protein
MVETLWSLAAFVGWAALVYKLWDLRRVPGSQSLRLVCATFTCLAVTATLASPSTYVAFDRLVGVPNLAELIMNACGMGFVLAVQRLLLLWAYPPQRARRRFRRWQALYVLALLAQVVLFVLAPVGEEAPWFIARYADTPFAGEFMVMIDVCLILTLTDIARLCWRYASAAGRRFLRLGLHSTGIGAIGGIVYFSLEALYVVARSARVSVFSGDLLAQLFAVFGLGCGLFIAGGLTIPAWGPRLARATAWIGKYRAYRRLHPLWLALYQASPSIALDAPTTLKDPLWINDLDYRLVRRVVEIRDGRLALRPYFSHVVAQHARRTAEHAGMYGVALRAAIEAATIADAIRAKREHTEPTDPCSLDAHGGADLAGEAAWLGYVARALTRLRPTCWPNQSTTTSEQALSAP